MSLPDGGASLPFIDWAIGSSGTLTAHRKAMLAPDPRDDGHVTGLGYFRDITKGETTILPALIVERFNEQLQASKFTSLFEDTPLEKDENSLVQVFYVADSVEAEPTSGHVPPRTTTSVEYIKEAGVSLYKIGTEFDEFAVADSAKGREIFNRQIDANIAACSSAAKLHMMKNTISTNPSAYLNAEHLSTGMTYPTTVYEAVMVMRHFVNFFGKRIVPSATMMAQIIESFRRHGLAPYGMVIPAVAMGIVSSGQGSTLFLDEGNKGVALRQNAVGARDGDEIGRSFEGLELIQLPVIGNTSTTDASVKILEAVLVTGSSLLFWKLFGGSEKGDGVVDAIGATSWFTNSVDTYLYANAFPRDLRMVQGTPGPSGSMTYEPREGILDYQLLAERYGADKDEFKTKTGRLFENAYTAFPDTRDEFARGAIDPFMQWVAEGDPANGIGYLAPVVVLGQFSRALSPDDDIFHGQDSFYRCLKKMVGNKSDDEDVVLDAARTITFGHPGLHGKKENDGSRKKIISYPDFMARLKELMGTPMSWKDATAQFLALNTEDDITTNAQKMNLSDDEFYVLEHASVFMAVQSQKTNNDVIDAKISASQDLRRRYEKAASFPDPLRRIAWLVYLTQPLCAQFGHACANYGVFNPFSGVIVRVSETSQTFSPVVVTNKIGRKCSIVRSPATSVDGAHKTGLTEWAVHVGATAFDGRQFFPIPHAVGGVVNQLTGGSGNNFMIDLIHEMKADESRKTGKKVVIDKNMFAKWRNTYVGKPKAHKQFSNFFIFQGTAAGRGEFPLEINLCGAHQPDVVYPFMRESAEFIRQPMQNYPGAAIIADLLDARSKTTFNYKPQDLPLPIECPFENIKFCTANNAMAIATCVRVMGPTGRPIWMKGNHIRGDRTDNTVEIDQGVYRG